MVIKTSRYPCIAGFMRLRKRKTRLPKKRIEYIQQHVRLEKVYLETHRDLIIAKEATIKKAKKYLESQGIEVAGGITLVANERDKFRSATLNKMI